MESMITMQLLLKHVVDLILAQLFYPQALTTFLQFEYLLYKYTIMLASFSP